MGRVLIFAKAPRLGLVKTRLAQEIGERAATNLYRQVGSRVVAQLAPLPLTVWYDPPDALDEMHEWLGAQLFRPQPTGDLGARLTAAFAEHFRVHESSAVAVGMDAPDVDALLVARAFGMLRRADVVIGPAKDGGYYLIGLSKFVPAVFQNIPWSTDKVLAATRNQCMRVGLETGTLERLADMDTLSDAQALGLWPQ